MKKTLFLIPFAIIFCMCKQQKAEQVKAIYFNLLDSNARTYQFTDANGLKQGRWYFLGRDVKNKSGYAARDTIEVGDFKDDKKDGIWTKYYPGNRIKSKIEYRNDSITRVIIPDSNKEN